MARFAPPWRKPRNHSGILGAVPCGSQRRRDLDLRATVARTQKAQRFRRLPHRGAHARTIKMILTVAAPSNPSDPPREGSCPPLGACCLRQWGIPRAGSTPFFRTFRLRVAWQVKARALASSALDAFQERPKTKPRNRQGFPVVFARAESALAPPRDRSRVP